MKSGAAVRGLTGWVMVAALGIGAIGGVAAAQKTAKGGAKAAATDEMAVVSPESEGFSSERLENLHKLIQGEIDEKQLAGAITILARHGKVVDYRTYGVKDLGTGAPMTKDVIFRDYSMTKPVTGVAMMILYEQGRWLPQDAIADYAPALAHLKVFNGVNTRASRSWSIRFIRQRWAS